jgi:hypothetical protein
MEYPVSAQFIFNIIFAIVSFFSGWMLKLIFGIISKVQEDNRNSVIKVQDDYRRLSEQVTNMAISLPQNYVSKDDFHLLISTVNNRFDKLEEKIDALKRD